MTLQIGIIGAAGIAPAAIIRPASRTDRATIAAVGARSAERAAAYAAEHGIPRSYGSYEELLADPELELIYIALPPSQHAEWSIKALRAGKDVLCEKPFALDADEARAMNAVAAETGKRLIEAFHDRYHPLWDATVAIAARLGTLRSVEGVFLVTNPYEPGTLRHEPALGGGALMDLGCYPLHWLRNLTGEEPAVESVEWRPNPSGADMGLDVRLAFPSGIRGHLVADMDAEFSDLLRIEGERGVVEIDNPVFAARGHSIRSTIDGIVRVETVAGRETYDHQLEAVIDALHSGAQLPTEGDDPVGNMAAIDAIHAAMGRG